MSDEPKTVWIRLRDAVRGWWGNDDDADLEVDIEDDDHPDLAFHLVVMAPLMIVLLAIARSLS